MMSEKEIYKDRFEQTMCLIDGATTFYSRDKAEAAYLIELGYLKLTCWPRTFEVTAKGQAEAEKIHHQNRIRNGWLVDGGNT